MHADERAVSREETLSRLIAAYEVPIRRMCCMYLRDADLAADAVGEYSMTAGDVIEKISMVCKDFSHSRTRLTQG